MENRSKRYLFCGIDFWNPRIPINAVWVGRWLARSEGAGRHCKPQQAVLPLYLSGSHLPKMPRVSSETNKEEKPWVHPRRQCRLDEKVRQEGSLVLPAPGDSLGGLDGSPTAKQGRSKSAQWVRPALMLTFLFGINIQLPWSMCFPNPYAHFTAEYVTQTQILTSTLRNTDSQNAGPVASNLQLPSKHQHYLLTLPLPVLRAKLQLHLPVTATISSSPKATAQQLRSSPPPSTEHNMWLHSSFCESGYTRRNFKTWGKDLLWKTR